MNVNEIRTKFDNIQIGITNEDQTKEVVEQIAFTNSEIIILDDYTIHDIIYDPEKKQTRLMIIRNDQKKE